MPWPHTLATAPVSKHTRALTVVRLFSLQRNARVRRSMKALALQQAYGGGDWAGLNAVARGNGCRWLSAHGHCAHVAAQLNDIAAGLGLRRHPARSGPCSNGLQRAATPVPAQLDLRVRPSSWGGVVSWCAPCGRLSGTQAVPEDEYRAAQDHHGHHHSSAISRLRLRPRPSSGEMMLITSAPARQCPAR